MIRKFAIFAAVVAAFLLSLPATALDIVPPAGYQGTPVDYGLRDLNKALAGVPDKPAKLKIYIAKAGSRINVAVKTASKAVPKKPESFAITRAGSDIAIIGSDDVGLMYGCFELAERLEIKGRAALDIRQPIVQSPKVEFRAVNPFLTLPYKETYEDWWFLQDDYWEGYLDLLARARINWIDLHGMYDIKTTTFPNIYPYFITSDKFPEVGVEPAVAKRNLDMLNKVIRMAKARGIKFAMMSYAASWDGPGLRKPPYENNEENLSAYTREVVRKMIESCPNLAMIGFRIGETGKSENFFKDSYIPAIKEAGRPIDLYTRTWLSKKPPILKIGQEFPGRFFIQIKYNGEQFGPPYIVSGGRMQKWHSYSYQDYYTYPKSYKIIYQLRANGTHRVFPWGNPVLAARANTESLLGGAIGLCVEPIDAYYPKYDFRHKDDSPNRWYKWQYERDWYWYNVWGRTGYNPSLANQHDVWKNILAKRFGKPAADAVYNAINWASMIVPDAYNSYSLGPDHRNHAPELECGGSVRKWAEGQPFDTQNILSPAEYAARLLANEPAGAATPVDMARYLANEAAKTRQYCNLARTKVKQPSPEFNDLMTELTALSYLGDYYSHKLRAAALFAVMQASSDPECRAFGGTVRIRQELEKAKDSWMKLAAIGDEHYKPFIDTLRMHTEEFTWTNEGRKLEDDFKTLDAAIAELKSSGKTGTAPSVERRGDRTGPLVKSAEAKTVLMNGSTKRKLKVTAVVTDPSGVAQVYLRTKPFPSERAWSPIPMTLNGSVYTAETEVLPEGLQWCIEAIDKDGNGTIWPDFRKETPYRCVLPWNAPMPEKDEIKALKSITRRKSLTSEYSAMIIGRSSDVLNEVPSEVHSSLMELVSSGMPLIVSCQNGPSWDGRWLGGGIRFSDKDADKVTLTGNHPIVNGVPQTLEARRIVNDELAEGKDWTYLADPKALAVRQHGKGVIILVQMDLRESVNNPHVRTLWKNILAFAKGESTKPVLVVEAGDGTVFDLLNTVQQPWETIIK